jgi:hypothetical protein
MNEEFKIAGMPEYTNLTISANISRSLQINGFNQIWRHIRNDITVT